MSAGKVTGPPSNRIQPNSPSEPQDKDNVTGIVERRVECGRCVIKFNEENRVQCEIISLALFDKIYRVMKYQYIFIHMLYE